MKSANQPCVGCSAKSCFLSQRRRHGREIQLAAAISLSSPFLGQSISIPSPSAATPTPNSGIYFTASGQTSTPISDPTKVPTRISNSTCRSFSASVINGQEKASTSPSPAQDASRTQPVATQVGSQLLSQPPLPPSSPPKSPIGSTSPSDQPELLPHESPTLVQTKSPARSQLQTLPQTQETNPIQPASKPTDSQPAQDLESKPKPVGSPSKLDRQPGKLLESEENSKPASKEQHRANAEGNQEINPTGNPEPDRVVEGSNEDKSKTKPEIHPRKPQPEARDELKKRNEGKPSSSPPKAGEITAELGISKPEHSKKQDNVAREEAAQNGSSGKESKIVISTMAWASSSDGERDPFEKEIKEGLSRLVLKVDVGHSERIGNGQPVSMITLAGENNGASMVIGSDTLVPRGFKHPKGNNEASCGHVEERWKHGCTENPAITANINSNAQSINNSAMHGSSCDARDPGVHLNLSSKKVEAASPRGQTEPLEPQKTAPRVTPEKRPSHEPRIRRRCLRALFMESSESDPENPQKPRRHGCRFCCEEKKKGEG